MSLKKWTCYVQWRKYVDEIANYLNEMAGVPNYRRYLNHFLKHHPEKKPLSEKEFHCKATDEKYGGTSMRRCC